MQRIELAVLAYTSDGAELAGHLRYVYREMCSVYLHSSHAAENLAETQEVSYFTDTAKLLKELWDRAGAILFISAAGIAVRTTAPFLKSKTTDPAILCMDDTARYVIPLVSGHLGGANAWAQRIADLFGSEAVITTSTDRHGVFAVDLYAEENGLVIEDPEMIRKISGALLAGEKAGWYCDAELAVLQPQTGGLIPCGRVDCAGDDPKTGQLPERPAVGITLTQDSTLPAQFEQELRLYPRNIYLGIGCRRGKSAKEIRAAASEALGQYGIGLNRVRTVASADRKKDEEGICTLARELRAEYVTFTPEELMQTEGKFSSSEYVRRTIGADNVCERSAVRSSGGELIVRKYAKDGITIAAARSRI